MPELHVPAVDFSSMGEQRLNVLANSFNSEEIAHYFEQRGELSKPWNLQILRLQKLKEMRQDLSHDEYMERLHDAHGDLMRLGRFWEGREAEVFGGDYLPPALIEPLPGSPDDR